MKTSLARVIQQSYGGRSGINGIKGLAGMGLMGLKDNGWVDGQLTTVNSFGMEKQSLGFPVSKPR